MPRYTDDVECRICHRYFSIEEYYAHLEIHEEEDVPLSGIYFLIDDEQSSSPGYSGTATPWFTEEECQKANEAIVPGSGDCIRAYREDVDPGDRPVMQWPRSTSLRQIKQDLLKMRGYGGDSLPHNNMSSDPRFSIRAMIARGSITR
jgi:hypothetical protein